MAKKTTKTEPELPKVKAEKAPKAVKPKAVAVKKTVTKATKPAKAEKLIKPVVTEKKAVEVYSRFTDFDISLFQSGKHYKLYEKLGSHVVEFDGVVGTYFAVWAPNAQTVSVIGNFNGWNKASTPLYPRWDGSGIWEGFVPNVGVGETYKYYLKSSTGDDL